MIHQWVVLVAGEEAGPEGFGRAVQWLEAFFYADDGILASPRSARLQATLDVLTGLFDRVGLQTNVKKTVGIVFQPCRMAGVHSEAAYERIFRVLVVNPNQGTTNYGAPFSYRSLSVKP